jgi:hypothetical protein
MRQLRRSHLIFTLNGEGVSMKIKRWVGAAPTLVLGLILSVGPTEAQVDQVELTRQIAEGGPAERFGAAYQVYEMGPENAGPALREALLLAFEEEAEAYRAYRQGEGPRPDIDVVGRLAAVVAEFRDPRAMQPLRDALGIASGAIRGLAAFGDPAVPYLVDAARTGETTEVITSALLALRFLAEGVGHVPLTSDSREDLIALARERMAPGQSSFTVLGRAIDLAVVLDDPGLWETVHAMAADPSEVASRLENPTARGVEWAAERARERLRGEPPLPRWYSWSPR